MFTYKMNLTFLAKQWTHDTELRQLVIIKKCSLIRTSIHDIHSYCFDKTYLCINKTYLCIDNTYLYITSNCVLTKSNLMVGVIQKKWRHICRNNLVINCILKNKNVKTPAFKVVSQFCAGPVSEIANHCKSVTLRKSVNVMGTTFAIMSLNGKY